MDRIFLDANIIFSAAYKVTSRLLELWQSPNVELISSQYAVDEARRNILLARAENIGHLESLISALHAIECITSDASLLQGVDIADKDMPILMASVEAGASHLLTGDKDHFGHLFGKTVGGVKILTPSAYLHSR